MSYRPLAHLSAGALDGVGTSEGGRRKLWGLGRVDVVLVTKCIASFFGEAATLASSTYALRLAARVPVLASKTARGAARDTRRESHRG